MHAPADPEQQLSPGQAVYEPFSGSGTTLIAAETTGRVCLAIELDPAYVDVAVAPLAGLHRQDGDAGGRRPELRGHGCGAAPAEVA